MGDHGGGRRIQARPLPPPPTTDEILARGRARGPTAAQVALHPRRARGPDVTWTDVQTTRGIASPSDPSPSPAHHGLRRNIDFNVVSPQRLAYSVYEPRSPVARQFFVERSRGDNSAYVAITWRSGRSHTQAYIPRSEYGAYARHHHIRLAELTRPITRR